MAGICSIQGDDDGVFAWAKRGIERDPTCYKPYWRLAKLRMKHGCLLQGCLTLLSAINHMRIGESTNKLEVLLEICSHMPLLTEKQGQIVLDEMVFYLESTWPMLVRRLSKNSQWDVIHCLIMGPPYAPPISSMIHHDWLKFADNLTQSYTVGCGYCLCLRATTTDLSTLMDAVERQTVSGINEWAANLVLALCLQGAELELLSFGRDETWYHTALRLCCLTGHFGLLRLILSRRSVWPKATTAVDKEKRTLLHVACLYFLDGESEQGKYLVDLLLDHGANPSLRDKQWRRPHDYLVRGSPMDETLRGRIGLWGRFVDEPVWTVANLFTSTWHTLQKMISGNSSLPEDRSLTGRGRSQRQQKPQRNLQTGDMTQTHQGKRHNAARPNCECEELLARAGECFKYCEDASTAYSTLLAVFECSRQNKCKHQIFQSLAVQLIVQQLSKSEMPDVPRVLLNSTSCLHHVVDELIQNKMWWPLFLVVMKAEQNGGEFGGLYFARKVPVKDLVMARHFCGEESQRCQMLDILRCNGVTIQESEQRGILMVPLQQKEFRVVEMLCKMGADPPLHAALHVAWEKGNFTLFKELLSLYMSDPQKYHILAPDLKDKHGYTVFAQAKRAPSTRLSQKAQELLQCFLEKLASKLDADHIKSIRDGLAIICVNFLINRLREFAKEEAVTARSSKADWSETARPLESEEDGFGDGESAFAHSNGDATLDSYERSERDTSHTSVVKGGTRKGQQGVVNLEKKQETSSTKNQDKDVTTQFDNLMWEVECTREVWKILHSKRLPSELRQHFIDCIQRVAEGERSRMLSKRVTKELKLYETKLSRGQRILWEEGVAFSPRLSNPETYIYSDVIRIWDIVLDHDKIRGSVELIKHSHEKGQGSAITKQLRVADGRPSDGRFKYPRKFVEVDTTRDRQQTVVTEQLMLYKPANAKEKEFDIVKFYNFSSSLVYSVLKNTEVQIDFPFRVTELEHSVIHLPFDKPVLLLGRSGTGKTTCCLYRMWSKYIQFKKSTEHMEDVCSSSDNLHQLFVTKNPVLCSEIQKNFVRMCQAECIASDMSSGERPLPHRLQDLKEDQYPLFLTSRQLILMLDASLPGPHFFERNKDGSPKSKIPGTVDEELDIFAPYTPLDEDPEKRKRKGAQKSTSRQTSTDKRERSGAKKEITYQMFADKIWPHIKQKAGLRENWHPSLVWMEIFSFIKGSFEALQEENGMLSLPGYERCGQKRAPNFTASREKVYILFKHYNDYKQRHGLYDEADLLFNIYKRLKAAGPDWPCEFHQIYVDETQDFTQAELALLIDLAQNPNHMFLSGDTAQCIMQGVSFRFEDLRTLFYEYAEQSQHSRDKGGAEVVQVPGIHPLTYNYRSHTGILNLASAVVDVLVSFFPESFDRLERDQGFLDGPKPVLFNTRDTTALSTLLAGRSRERSSQIEFGAHQAILVVSDAARDSLPAELSQAIVLTIYESKGLEFDDVLVYNFFKDSQAQDEWRAVLHYLHPEDRGRLSGLRPLAFNTDHHKILSSELKQLYTAVTRAKVSVWFFDEMMSPMFDYFHALNLLQVSRAGLPGSEDQQAAQRRTLSQKEQASSGTGSDTYAKQSTPAEWEKQGDMFMKRQLYEQAAKCYHNAHAPHKWKIALAHSLALAASRPTMQSDARKLAYFKAAILLLQSADALSLQPSAWVTQYEVSRKAESCLRNAGFKVQAAQNVEKLHLKEKAGKQ